MSTEKNRFDKQYFESFSSAGRALLKGWRPLQDRFWLIYLKRHRKKGRLLDIGCGMGFFLEYAEKFYETYGMDVSEYAIKEARGRLHSTKLFLGNVNQLGLKSNCFDTVTCFDVLEHLEKPELAIKECYRVLQKGGFYIFSVPNTDSYGLKWKKEKWRGYRDPTHATFLSSKEWSQLPEKNGFTVIDRFYNGLTDSPYFKGVPFFHPSTPKTTPQLF